MAKKNKVEEVELSHPDKVLFPESGITKQDIADYYEAVANYMLPHLKDRPISMQRFPNGIDHQGFYQKEAPDYFPDYIKRAKVKLKNGESKEYVMVNNAETLTYLTNIGCIPIHTWLSKKGKLNNPDMLVWDFDPSDKDFEKVREAAFIAREFFNKADIEPFLKTTGSRGLHIIIPIKPDTGFTQVRALARKISAKLAKQHPDLMTTETLKDERGHRVFVDYLRNGFAQTAVAPYSVRPKEGAPVAAPISWEELEDKKLDAQTFTIHNTPARLKKKGDLLAHLHQHAFSFKALEKCLG